MIYTLFSIVKHQTKILGYWKEGNKTYIDNVVLIQCSNKDTLKDRKQELFSKGELSIFYKDNKQAYIEDKKGNITILNKRIEYKYKKGYKNIQIIKDIMAKYNGCTVYKKRGHILIEV